MPQRYICIHAHFYQPPRENPWLEDIEYQDSAYPYHDWNERIGAECYAPNGLSRIMDKEDWVARIVNNYEKISFNFGPTLLSWIEDKAPQVYQNILEGDRLSLDRFSGHGSAIAQAYNHLIMPLANRRDRETQIIWGLKDFQKRFGRDPESMWLPETAVDLESLDMLADYGMKYVILAPRQASQIRSLKKDGPWKDVSHEKVDPKEPYLVNLPSGRSIAAFFYDGATSRSVAFEGLLHNGETFAHRLVEAFSEQSGDQLVHIATDGETYGHHHRHGEMALSYALDHIERHKLAHITNYGEYLEKHPPKMEAKIFDNSSWSCVHGVERWRSNCGCNSGTKGEWHQKWRGPLRESFDFLRNSIGPRYEEKMQEFTDDPWKVRDAYISVILDRSPENREVFVKEWMHGEHSTPRIQTFIKYLEIQRQLLLMYTSCAWFFDEISGIESVQTLKYAYRAIELAKQNLDLDLENGFKSILEKAPSNLSSLKNGKIVFEKYVRPALVDLRKVGTHFAVSSLFEDYERENHVYAFNVSVLDMRKLTSGKTYLLTGKFKVSAEITLEEDILTFGVIHFGDQNLNAGVRPFESDDVYNVYSNEAQKAFNSGDLPEVIRVFDRHFGENLFTLRDLFRDEQRKVVQRLLTSSLDEVKSVFRQFYDQHYPLMNFLRGLDFKLPNVFKHIAEFSQNTNIRDLLRADEPDIEQITDWLEKAKNIGVNLDIPGLELEFQTAIDHWMQQLEDSGNGEELLKTVVELVEAAQQMPFGVDLWSAQNRYVQWHKTLLEQNHHSETWKEWFHRLGEGLRVRPLNGTH